MKTGLLDTRGLPISYGNIVHWTDGGDELPLDERIRNRWDRIAVVEKLIFKGKERPEICFRVIDSPNEYTRNREPVFNYGSFIYKDTENYLTVVAFSEKEYYKKFQNAGECMEWVLEVRGANK